MEIPHPDIATVDSLGVVTAVGSGNAIIEVICNGNRTLSNNANVICVTAQDVIDGISYRFELNEKAQIANAYVIRPKTGSYAGDVVIPQFVQHGSTFKVRGIDNNAFALMADLTSVSIPATVDTMGLNAFRNCSNLKRVNITNLDSWMNISFRDPQATPFNMDSVQMYLNGELVTAVHIPGTMKTLKPYVFQGVSSIKSLVIDNGVRLISQNAFKNCKNLQAVVIPSSVDSIGMSAFSGCSSLASVQLPEGIKTIASSAFSNTGLTKITLPESVTLVDNQASQNCAALKTATLGSPRLCRHKHRHSPSAGQHQGNTRRDGCQLHQADKRGSARPSGDHRCARLLRLTQHPLYPLRELRQESQSRASLVHCNCRERLWTGLLVRNLA